MARGEVTWQLPIRLCAVRHVNSPSWSGRRTCAGQGGQLQSPAPKGCDVLTAKRQIRTILSFAVIALILSSIPAAAGYFSYKVRPGDTLWDLSKKHGTTPKAIAKLSKIREHALLPVGKAIRIPTKRSSTNRAGPTGTAPNIGAEMHTNTENVCLRSGAGTTFRKIAVLRAGSTGKVLARKGSWTKIAFGDGTCGYIYSKLLAPEQGPVAYSRNSPVPRRATASPGHNTELIHTALSCRGLRYRYGGTSRGGFDCSGFTRYVFAKYGVSLPHSSKAQARMGTHVSRNDLQPGDLVFFHTYRPGISHVGIHIGDGKFVHAARRGRGVRTDSLNSGYYSSRYRGARRVR